MLSFDLSEQSFHFFLCSEVTSVPGVAPIDIAIVVLLCWLLGLDPAAVGVAVGMHTGLGL